MKKLFVFLSALTVFAALTGCGGSDAENAAEPSPAATADTVDPQATVDAQIAVSSEVFETPVEVSGITGQWVNEENSVSIRFNEDGTYVNDSIEGSYVLDGNTLTLNYYGGEVSEEYSIGLRDGRLVLVRGDLQLIFDKTE